MDFDYGVPVLDRFSVGRFGFSVFSWLPGVVPPASLMINAPNISLSTHCTHQLSPIVRVSCHLLFIIPLPWDGY